MLDLEVSYEILGKTYVENQILAHFLKFIGQEIVFQWGNCPMTGKGKEQSKQPQK